MNALPAASGRLPLLVWLSLAAVYFVWGSTYLAIHFALAEYPPLFFPGLRFVIAGSVLMAFLRLRGHALPTRRQVGFSIVIGFLLLNVGNGAVVYAQQSVGSALAATAVATMPLWASLFGGIWGAWPKAMQWLGLLVGFSGIVLLNLDGDFAANPLSASLLIIAPVSWAFGSVWSRRIDLPKGAMSTACQMLSAGVVFLGASHAAGESWQLVTTPKAMLSVVYLTLAGSVLAFSAYIYLVQTVSPSLATSYAYVNPVIALLLGVTFGGEVFTATELAAIVLVLAGVLLIVLYNRPAPAQPVPTASGAAKSP